MTLLLLREPTVEGCTLGSLYVDGHWALWTLEDAIREVPGLPVASWKIPRQTAIPAGRYRVRLTLSNRFQRVLPLIESVPGFDGVRIHHGNTIHDTDGCPLVGTGRAWGRVTGSRVALEKLMGVLSSATDDIWITVENPR
jgi:hypothetical protein